MSLSNQQPEPGHGVNGPTHLGKASFSVSSRVALQLGRESISSSITAVVELVKNAYDADAEEVHIRFAHLGTPDAFMVIEDTGEGMTLEDLRDRWMVIGTDNKVEKCTTGKKRSVTGEKGLGRLGLDRLCNRTTVESIKSKANQGIRLEVDWRLYEKSSKRLETVEHDLYSIPGLHTDPITGNPIKFDRGTRLILRGLKDSWTHDGLMELRHELALLVSPFSGPEDFAIYVDSGTASEELNGKVEFPQSLLDKCDWQVEANLDAAGRMDILMKSPRHDIQFRMEPTPWAEAIKKMGDFPRCGPLRMEFYFFLRRDSELAGQTLKAADITAFIKNNQGIRIYRDGFRVKPYGEPDGSGDWLKLAYRRMQNPEGITQKNWRVGYNQLVGAVFIRRADNPELNDQTNREGLLVGDAFAHLRAFASRVITFFEQKAHFVRLEQKTETEKAGEKAKASLEGTGSAIQSLERIVSQFFPPGQKGTSNDQQILAGEEIQRGIVETKKVLEQAKAELEESSKLYQRAEEQKNTMANLASLGILAAAFGHETVNWSGNAVANAKILLKRFIDHPFWILPDERQNVETKIGDLIGESEKVWNLARFTIGNLSRQKRQQMDFCIRDVVTRVFTAFSEVLVTQKRIKVNISDMAPGPCKINGFEIDAESIIINLISNSVWALTDRLEGERHIIVTLHRDQAAWQLTFDDSGIGLEAGDENAIFLPGHTTKRNDHGELVGTGMGLFIVKSFVEEHFGGSITAVTRGPLGGARFVIRIPETLKKESV